MNNREELKILLALNGNKRIPHMEEEIFANGYLTRIYLTRLVAGIGDHDDPELFSNGYHIFYYARDVIKARWYEAEAAIKDTGWWYEYKHEFDIK